MKYLAILFLLSSAAHAAHRVGCSGSYGDLQFEVPIDQDEAVEVVPGLKIRVDTIMRDGCAVMYCDQRLLDVELIFGETTIRSQSMADRYPIVGVTGKVNGKEFWIGCEQR